MELEADKWQFKSCQNWSILQAPIKIPHDSYCLNFIETFSLGSSNEVLLGIVAICFEGIPQLMILAAVMTHWHGDFDTTAMDFFGSNQVKLVLTFGKITSWEIFDYSIWEN